MSDKKAFAISKVIAENAAAADSFMYLLQLMNNLASEDMLKIMWLATGAASTMKAIHDEKAK